MKRITDFIVQRRNIILVIFVMLAGISAVVMGQVKINHDMAEYLPETSSVRIGMDAMTEEFGENETSNLTVMLKDLSEEEKTENLAYLENLEGVAEVSYDESEEYNKDGYTRFVVTVDGVADSEQATVVYNEVKEHFEERARELAKNAEEKASEDYAATLSGAVADQNHEVLPMWILALAVGCAFVILVIMSESYVEPVLFLLTILIAVLLNKGTNLIFPSVSNITDSITAILQLALSMDYSIMLMERYRQEKETEPDKVAAMKKALHHAFTAISSSSITTVVGLLALVFMSFTIGRDMGLVLAKGVLFSLIAIFTCLPGLILLFDKLIEKTKKKSPNIKLTWLGKAAHSVRYGAIVVFLVIFGASYLLKGNLGILYTDTGTDKVGEVFGAENQMAVLYRGEDEERVAEYCRGLTGRDQLGQVFCYGNTIGEPLLVEDLPAKMDDLGAEMSVEDYMLKIVYYHYYHGGRGGNMTLDELVNFVQSEVYSNEKMVEHVDAEMRNNIAKVSEFANVSAVNRKRSGVELSETLGIEAGSVDDLLIYYNSKQTNARLTLNQFTHFLNTAVVNNAKYGASFNAATRSNLQTLEKFSERNLITAPLEASGMAQILGMDPQAVAGIYQYYAYLKMMEQGAMQVPSGDVAEAITGSVNNVAESSAVSVPESGTEMGVMSADMQLSLAEFVNFVLAHRNDEMLAGSLTPAAVQQLTVLRTTMQSALGGVQYSASGMANVLGMDVETARLLYSLYEVKMQGKTVSLSLNEFLCFLTSDVMQNAKYAESFDAAAQTKIYAVYNIVQDTLAGRRYTASELVNSLSALTDNLDQNLIELVYIYYGSVNEYDMNWKLTVEELVNYLNDTILTDVRFDEFLDAEMRDKIADAKETVHDAKGMLVGENFSRVILNTKLEAENEETFAFIQELKDAMAERSMEFYVIGDSAMAYEMSQTFGSELDMITLITMIFIFVVVALTFGSILIPIILVLLIQCAVFATMGILSMSGEPVYFIALLIVQSILMGATIDYAILYTSYYIESRKTMNVKSAMINSYNKSIQAIMTSSLILILVTLIVGSFTDAVIARILITISQGTTCAVLLILLLLPAMLAACDKLIIKRKRLVK